MHHLIPCVFWGTDLTCHRLVQAWLVFRQNFPNGSGANSSGAWPHEPNLPWGSWRTSVSKVLGVGFGALTTSLPYDVRPVLEPSPSLSPSLSVPLPMGRPQVVLFLEMGLPKA